MLAAITAQADAQGRYTAGSMYQAWKGWSFADKKRPSPWLTFLALRVQQRVGAAGGRKAPAVMPVAAVQGVADGGFSTSTCISIFST